MNSHTPLTKITSKPPFLARHTFPATQHHFLLRSRDKNKLEKEKAQCTWLELHKNGNGYFEIFKDLVVERYGSLERPGRLFFQLVYQRVLRNFVLTVLRVNKMNIMSNGISKIHLKSVCFCRQRCELEK